MPTNDANWTTVSGKTKTKGTNSSSSKSTAAPPPPLPTAEVKTIKLSDSAFSSMKDRIPDENNENQSADVKPQKIVSNTDKNVASKTTKPTKTVSNSLSLKQGLQNINLDKIKALYKSSKDNTALWIDKVCYWFVEQFKDVTSGLQDPLFSKESNTEYPLSALPSTVRDYFNEIFDAQSKIKAITLCRNGLVHPNADLNSVVAYQVLLQYFLRNLNEKPDETFFEDIDTLAASLKRYQSEKVLRLLWAYSQISNEQAGLALKIWFRLMFPFIENRTYNQLIVDNLSQITSRNIKPNKFFPSNELFPVESFVKLLDFLDRPNPALSREMRASLIKSANSLSELFINNSKNLSQNSNAYFRSLFPLLQGDKERSSKNQTIIDRMILACLTDQSVTKTWLNLHKDYPQNSLQLLSLIQTDENINKNLFSSKDVRNLIQQLRTLSTDENTKTNHKEFLRVYDKTDKIVGNQRTKRSKSRIGSIFKFLVLFSLGFFIYSNWLWITVATEYFLEDYLKHPTAIVIREQLNQGLHETKKLTAVALKNGEEYVRKTLINLEPYVIKLGQNIQIQWNVFLKYVEGPVYDKSIEIAEQIQRLSIVVFKQSVHYLNGFFEWASYYTNIYARQIYEQWSNLDTSALRDKFDQLRMRIIKSV